jgi:hypothetical protein
MKRTEALDQPTMQDDELERAVSRLKALIAEGNEYAALTLARIIGAGTVAAQRRALAKVKRKVEKELAEVEAVHEELRGRTNAPRKLALWTEALPE